VIVVVQVADLSHENFKSSRVMRCDLVDFQVVLVPSQVVNVNPSDSQVYLCVIGLCKNSFDIHIHIINVLC